MKNIIIILTFILFNQNISFCQSAVTDFTYDIRKVNCDYYLADFYYTSTSTEDADSCCWDFGDGVLKCRSNTNAASHNYSKPGTFSVTLTLWKGGIKSSITKIDLVRVSTPPTPNFELIISDTNLHAPLDVVFQNTTELGDCEEVNYTWNFGDGNSSQDKNPEYIFNNPKTYYVSLYVSDTLGCEKEYSDYVVVKDTAQIGEFEFIKSDCINDNETSTCGYDKNYKLINDSLIIYGLYYGNCGTQKTATIRYDGDTVIIKTWEVGPLTTCSCGNCFEIIIPNITKDSVIIIFDGEKISSIQTNIVEHKNKNLEISVFPNPTDDFLTLVAKGIDLTDFKYKVLNTEGRIIKTGILNDEFQIDTQNLTSDIYMLLISDIKEKKRYVARFIKE